MEQEREWILAERTIDKGLSLIRLKKLEASFPFRRYPERLNVIWSFRETEVDDTPADIESEAMERFENRICERIENSERTILCIVFTDPGYREYVFYSKDVDSFLEVLSEMPQESEPYPIEIHHETDKVGELYTSYAVKLIKS